MTNYQDKATIFQVLFFFAILFSFLVSVAVVGKWVWKGITNKAEAKIEFPDLSHDKIVPFSALTSKVKDVAYENLLNDYMVLLKSNSKPIINSKSDVVALIAKKAYEAGLDPIKSLQIAKAESGFDSLAKNKHSSAKGVYQFLDRTWENYCVGDVLNAEDNIDCFINYFPAYPGWWLTAKDY